MTVASCDALDDLIQVDNPSQIVADDLEDPADADLLVNGVAASFHCAFSAYIVTAGLFGDELAESSNGTSLWEVDRRQLQPNLSAGGGWAVNRCEEAEGWVGLVTPLSTARWQADQALDRLQGWSDAEVPERTGKIATVAAFAGYSYLLLGESMCEMSFDLGPAVPSDGILDLAETRFSTALTAAEAAGVGEIANLARVGRARTRLNLGDLSGAAADAAAVDDGFIYNAAYSLLDRQRTVNNVFMASGLALDFTIEDDFRDYAWNGVPDSRVAVVSSESLGGNPTGFDGVTPVYVQMKYGSLTASIPLARSTEARLIIAEAEGGQTAVDIINELHDAAGLPEFAGGTAEEIRDQIIYERRAEFFLESHHLGDVRRYDLEFTPAPGTPFSKGGVYGSERCFPIPDNERRTNPNL